MLKTLTLIAALAAATAGVAASARLTDVQFLKAARCEALMTSPALGGGDGAGIKAVVKAQRAGRVAYIYDKADQVREDAERQIRHAQAEQKASLIAERDGACQAFLGEAATHTAAGAAPPKTAD
jgi:hypothetical protein